MTNIAAVESDYRHFLALCGDAASAAMLTLAAALQREQPATSNAPLTVAAAAKQLGVSQRTVYDLCDAGKLRHHRIGKGRGTIRITPDAVAEYQHANEPTATPRDLIRLAHVAGKR